MQTPWLKLTFVVALGGLPLGAVGARASLALDQHDALNDLPLPLAQEQAVRDGLATATPRSRPEVESYAAAALAHAPEDADSTALARLYARAFNAAASFAGLPDHAHVVRSEATLWGLALGELAWVSVPDTHAIAPLTVCPQLSVAGIGGDITGNLVGDAG